MQYPKQFMSITDLTKMGLSRDYLKQLARAEGAPIIKTVGGGKIYFRTADLDAFMDKISKRTKPLKR